MSRRAACALAAGLVVLIAGVYQGVRHHDFVSYDDPIYVVENPNLREPFGLASVVRAFREPYETNWIPLTWISLHADYAVFGPEPAAYLLENVALHALATLLLFAALARATGALGRSAFVAAVFAVHPLHVESVAWVAERKDTLSAVCFAAALLAWVHYAARPGLARYGLAAGASVLGLLAKPMGVTLPFVLLLLDFWPLGRLRAPGSASLLEARRVGRALGEKLPLLAAAVAVAVVTVAVQSDAVAMRAGMLRLDVRLANAVESYAWYVVRSFWPSGLAVFYPHPLGNIAPLRVALAALALVAISALALRSARARPYLAVGWLWYVGMLVPVIGFVQAGMQARADRYAYLPQIGLGLMVAWGAVDLLGRRPAARRGLALAGLASVLALAVAASFQVRHWRDTRALWERALAVTPDNFFAHHGLAGEHLAADRPEEALVHFREAARLKPRWPSAHLGVGDALTALGRPGEAEPAYRRALRLAPRNARAHESLGQNLLERGRADEAIPLLERALALCEPDRHAEVQARLASAFAAAGRLPPAIRHYREALARDPDRLEARANLGFVLARARRYDDATRELERAVAGGLESPEVFLGLAEAALATGRREAAARHYREALRLRPGWPHAANNLAWILATAASERLRRPQEAIAVARSIRGGPGANPAWLDTLAAAYAAAGRFPEAERTAARAVALAEQAGAPVEALRERLALYREGRVYVEP